MNKYHITVQASVEVVVFAETEEDALDTAEDMVESGDGDINVRESFVWNVS